MKKLFLLTTLCVMLHYTGFSQIMPAMGGAGGGQQQKIYDGRISGIVIDKQTNNPVEIANVALYKINSHKPIDGTITDAKGIFRLKNIKPGWYRLTVSFLGFSPKNIDSIQITDKKYNIDLGRIIIEPNTEMLKEAVIEAEAPLIETKIDKLIYNADKDISTKGGNATDVLRKVPMLTVDLEGNVSMQGTQNIKVLINNKPSSVMASSVAEALKMIPADEIEKVEVITSPSAKYDAEGTGGIINIITKKKNVEGVSGSVYAGAGTRSSNLFGNLNLRSGRYGTGFSLGGFGYRGKGKLETSRTTDYSLLTQNGTNENLGWGPFIQWTNDYDFISKNNISSSIRVRNFRNETEGNTYNLFTSDLFPVSSGYNNAFNSKTDGWNYDANLDYRRKFSNDDHEFSASAQITHNERNTDYDISRTYDSPLIDPYAENSLNKSTNREITFQTDYVHPFNKQITLETGAKTILRDVVSDYSYQTRVNGYFEEDTGRNNVFDYRQQVFAGYLQGSVNLKSFGVKTGLRYERTEVDGNFRKGNTASFGNEYGNFVPSATLSYRKAGKYSFKISYTQRIQRPSMFYLNPYVNNSDPTSISYGNPYLNAEKSHAFELGNSLFKKFGSINTSIYHRFTNNAIESIRFIDTNDVYITTYDNIGKNYSTGISIGSNIMWKKLILGGNLNAWYYKVKSVTENDVYNDGINYNVNMFVNLKLNQKWGIQGFGNFNGPRFSLQGKSTSFFYYNLSARYSLKGEKGGIGVGLDNFATPYIWFRNEYKGKDFVYNNSNRINFIGVRISFDYRFGKMTFSNQSKKKIKNDDLKEGGEDNQGQMVR
jgi:outer membrane receptor protein involved in Fe transport